MPAPETFPAHQDASSGDQTVAVINSVIAASDGILSPDALIRRVQERAQAAPCVDQVAVQQYVAGLRGIAHGAVIAVLPPGIGGQCDGSGIEIAASTVEVDGSVSEAVARMQEVADHEVYHLLHRHTQPMEVAADAGPYAVIIGGEGFDTTELLEGLTVARTGDHFVSAQYRHFKARLLSAAGSDGISLTQIEQAVNSGDLKRIHSPVS